MYPALTTCDCRYGAPMGRPDWTPDKHLPIKLYLRRLDFVDYCYDKGAAYWGMGDPIYRAVGHGTEEVNEMFVRARNREDAKRQVLEVFTKAKFYR